MPYPDGYSVGMSRQSTSALVVALLATLASVMVFTRSGASGDEQPTLRLTPIMISAHAGYFEGEAGMASADNRGFMSNAGFVITPDGVVVFDALATPALARAMLAAIAERSDAPVRHVVVSHYHADHVYGLQVFADAGATIWAHEAGKVYLESDAAAERLAERRESLAPWVNTDTRLVPASRWLTLAAGDVHTLTLGDRQFEIIGGGGAHAPGDLMLRVPSEGSCLPATCSSPAAFRLSSMAIPPRGSRRWRPLPKPMHLWSCPATGLPRRRSAMTCAPRKPTSAICAATCARRSITS